MLLSSTPFIPCIPPCPAPERGPLSPSACPIVPVGLHPSLGSLAALRVPHENLPAAFVPVWRSAQPERGCSARPGRGPGSAAGLTWLPCHLKSVRPAWVSSCTGVGVSGEKRERFGAPQQGIEHHLPAEFAKQERSREVAKTAVPGTRESRNGAWT